MRWHNRLCRSRWAIFQSCALVAASCFLLAVPSEVCAQTGWTGATGSWFDSNNWSAGVPHSGNHVNVSNGGTSQVFDPGADSLILIVGGVTPSQIEIADDGTLSSWLGLIGREENTTGQITVAGSDANWTLGAGMTVGTWGNGQLAISDGGAVTTPAATIGQASGSHGTVTIDGNGSEWRTSNLSVGLEGRGELLITGGGDVISELTKIGDYRGGIGVATIRDAGSTWNVLDFRVGEYGEGWLSVEQGAVVHGIVGRISGGYLSGSTAPDQGHVTVTGVGSALHFESGFLVGEFGGANLTISAGGTVTNSDGRTGSSQVASVNILVTGSGSSWINHAGLTVGGYGDVELTVADGGLVSSGDADVANFASSQSSVKVTGAGSRWNNATDLYIGGRSPAAGGTGSVTVTDQGQVEVGGLTKLWNAGTLTLDGGSMTTGSLDRRLGAVAHHDGVLRIAGGSYQQNSGPLYVSGNTATALPTLEFADGATTTGITSINVGRFAGGRLIVSSGSVLSNSSSSIIGTFSESHGEVLVEGHQSRWAMTGTLTIGNEADGTLTVTEGGTVTSGSATLGVIAGVNGVASVTGADSSWSVAGNLNIGSKGTGKLAIGSGGRVAVDYDLIFTKYDAASRIELAGGTLTAAGILADTADFYGVGTIEAQGIVSDLVLVIDAARGTQQQLVLDDSDRNIDLKLDLNSNGPLGAGFRGNGSLAIADGVAVESRLGVLSYFSGSQSVASVAGANTSWSMLGSLTVGREGRAELVISDQASVTSGIAVIGQSSNAHGIATVSGAGANLTTQKTITVGQGGTAQLVVVAGASLTSGDALIAQSPSSTAHAVVSGTGSEWTNNGPLTVGQQGEASLTIADGGLVTTRTANVGGVAGSKGKMIIRGNNARLTVAQTLAIGGVKPIPIRQPSGGEGEVTVEEGGGVRVTGETTLFPHAKLWLAGGSLETAAVRFDGTGGQFEWTSGSMRVGVFGGSLTNLAGVLAALEESSQVEVNGNYTQSADGTLAIRLLSQVDYDRLSVSGTATLDGTLEVTLADEFAPAAGDSFSILAASQFAGQFQQHELPELAETLVWNTNRVATAGILQVTWAGDFDGSGTVDTADYTTWRDGLGTIYTLSDYDQWKANFGRSSGGGGMSPAAVPEPAGLALVLCALLLVCRFHLWNSRGN